MGQRKVERHLRQGSLHLEDNKNEYNVRNGDNKRQRVDDHPSKCGTNSIQFELIQTGSYKEIKA